MTYLYTTMHRNQPVGVVDKGNYFGVEYINKQEFSFTTNNGSNGERDILSEYIRDLQEQLEKERRCNCKTKAD